MTSKGSTGKKPPFTIDPFYARWTQVSADMTIFKKTIKNSWQSVISSQPMKRGYITEIDIKMITSHHKIFGFTQKDTSVLSTNPIGIMTGKACGLGTANGLTHSHNTARPYGPTLTAGDVLTCKIDLREGHFTIEYLKNGHSMGLAFAGLQNWNQQIYWGASLHHVGSAFQILAFREYKQ